MIEAYRGPTTSATRPTRCTSCSSRPRRPPTSITRDFVRVQKRLRELDKEEEKERKDERAEKREGRERAEEDLSEVQGGRDARHRGPDEAPEDRSAVVRSKRHFCGSFARHPASAPRVTELFIEERFIRKTLVSGREIRILFGRFLHAVSPRSVAVPAIELSRKIATIPPTAIPVDPMT